MEDTVPHPSSTRGPWRGTENVIRYQVVNAMERSAYGSSVGLCNSQPAIPGLLTMRFATAARSSMIQDVSPTTFCMRFRL